MKPGLRQLEVFVAVAEHGRFARAAEALYISQPTVSQEIARLESQLGVRLFDRSVRPAALTPAGSTLFEGAQRLLNSLDDLVGSVRQFEDTRQNSVRIVVSPSVENRLLPAIIAYAETRFPELQIVESTVETGQVSAQLVESRGDIGLGRFLRDDSAYARETIAQEPIVVALGDQHPLVGSSSLSLADLRDTPLLLWPREQHPDYYDYLIELCRGQGLDPLILMSPPRIVGSRQFLLAEGRAFSLVPRSTAATLPGDITGVPLDRPARLPLQMQWRIDDTRHEVAELRQAIRTQAAGLDD